MPHVSASAKPAKLGAFVPCAWFTVLKPFVKYRHHGKVSPGVSEKFLYLSMTGHETILAGAYGGDYESYDEGATFELAVADYDYRESVGTIFRVFGKEIFFTTGEINVLCEKGVISLRVK